MKACIETVRQINCFSKRTDKYIEKQHHLTPILVGLANIHNTKDFQKKMAPVKKDQEHSGAFGLNNGSISGIVLMLRTVLTQMNHWLNNILNKKIF